MDIWNFIQYICGQVGKYCKESDSGAGAMTQKQRALAVLLEVPQVQFPSTLKAAHNCITIKKIILYINEKQ